jgi:regulator of protease activity HflC (stomatin/prohibitin superfamily)
MQQFNSKDLLGLVIVIFFFILLFNSATIVNAGQRGVIVRLGNVQDRILDEGLHLKLPFLERVVKMDVTNQKIETEADAASRDLQSVNTTIAVNYSLRVETVNTLFQQVRRDYQKRLIDPAIQEAVKAATARFNAEELITKRPEVRNAIIEDLVSRLSSQGIDIINVSIVNFSFSAAFNAAIEEKQVAEQRALQAERDLQRIEIEAKQRIAQAEAEAQAIRITGQALANNPALVELEAVKKWNGILPTYSGGPMPFLNLNR